MSGNRPEVGDGEEMVQKMGERAERDRMSFLNLMGPNRQRSLAVLLAVVMLAVVLLVASCGTGESDSGAAPTTVATTPTSERIAEPPETLDTEQAELDDGHDLFRSAVGENYTMTFEFVSSVSAEAGPIVVTVVGGRVESATYPDAMTEQVLPEIPMLTVADFFERAGAVLAGGGLVEATFDRSYGYPLAMSLDPIPGAIDDEMSVRIIALDPISDDTGGDGY